MLDEDLMTIDSDSTRTTIIIIGAGYAGLRFLAESVEYTRSQKLEDSVRYIIVDGRIRSNFGRGVAWQSDQNPHMRTNMHSPEITADPNNGKTVADYLGVSYDQQPTASELFSKRELVGEIFARDFNAVERRAKDHGIEIECIQDEVIDIERKGFAYRMRLQHCATCLDANYVVLALGHIPPTNYPHLFGSPNYIRNPWAPSRELETIPNNDRVAVIGLGPTSVDTIIRLRDGGLRQVLAYSRSGAMQYPRPIPGNFEPKIVTASNISKVADTFGGLRYHTFSGLLLSEFLLQGVDWRPFLDAVRMAKMAPHDSLRHGFAQCHRAADWFGLITSLTEALPTAWHLLDDRDREKFQNLHSLVSNVLYGMAPSHALRMLRELDERSLKITGGLEKIEFNTDTTEFEISTRQDGELKMDTVDHVVDCSGFGKDITKSETPLVIKLLERGLLRPHKFGGAIVDFETGQVARDNDGRSLRIYCLTGSLNIGCRFVTNGLGHVASSAKRTAREIHLQLDHLGEPGLT